MRNPYEDIRERIHEPPLWWDSNGVPRYADFHPDHCPDIYADEVALVRIACHSCGKQFEVEFHWSLAEAITYMGEGADFNSSRLSTNVQCLHYGDPTNVQCLHYGDPPFHELNDCCSGSTMNCDDLGVVQFWKREHSEWIRVPELEGMFPLGISI